MKSKATIALLLLTLLCSLNGYSVTYTHFQNTNDFDFVLQDDGATAIIPSTTSSLSFSFPDDTVPALPCCYVNILLPLGECYSSLNYEIMDEEVVPNVTRVAPSQRIVPVSSADNISDENLNNSLHNSSIYPDSVVRILGVHFCQPYYFVSVQICPFIYTPDSCLSLIKELSINIATQETFLPTLEDRNISPLLNIVVNPEAASTQTNMSVPSRYEDNLDYLIITNNNLLTSFETLVQWKNIKGVRTKVISTEEIDSIYSDASIQLKIKHCIKDYYQNKNLKYVLLGGDDIIVPVRRCYAQVGNYESNIPTDKFYVCFDGAFDWDANANGVIGEVTDNVVLVQYVHISRLPVRTREDVLNYTQKLLKYEQNPSLEYVNKFLLCAKMLWNNKPSGYSDAHEKSEKFYNSYIAPYWNGTKYRFYDTDTDFGGPSYDLVEDNINYQINSGYHFIHYDSHGSETSLSAENGSYSVSSVSELHNVTTPVLFTTAACETNHFDNGNSTCLSEAFILHPQGGAIGYWGSSRYGWGYKDTDRSTSLGPSFQYNGIFFRQLFGGHIYHFAELAAATKNHFIAQSSTNGAPRWLQYSINAMGDAEMPIYTETPASFENVSVIRSNDTIYVDTDGISATVAVTSGFGEQYFSVLNDVSSCIFTNVPAEYSVVITKHNHVPYIYQDPLYIQDQTIANSRTYNSKTIFVGQQVSPVLPFGEVQIVNHGNLNLQYSDQVILEAGTSVNLGGTLQIEPLP